MRFVVGLHEKIFVFRLVNWNEISKFLKENMNLVQVLGMVLDYRSF